MDDGDSQLNIKPKKPRKILKIKPSKYEFAEALHTNKKYWKNVFRYIDASHEAVSDESVQLANTLPADIYRKVCETLNIPMASSFGKDDENIKVPIPRRLIKEPMLSYRKCIFINRDMDSDTDVEICSSDEEDDKLNIHQELLSKPEREQITWATHYLQPEREDEKTLVKKADDLTDKIYKTGELLLLEKAHINHKLTSRAEYITFMVEMRNIGTNNTAFFKSYRREIANNFCEYMQHLGGDQHSKLFTPEAIKELFRIEFDTHAARSLRVIPKEMPTIEEQVAINTGNPEKSRYEALEREISKDIRAEYSSNRITAFGQSLPFNEQFCAPQNNTKKMWRSARHVPKELVTLKTVWEGITNLRSVKEYCRWMIDHPEHRRPPYLNSLGMFDPAVLDARITLESKYHIASTAPTEAPASVDHIRRRLSELADS